MQVSPRASHHEVLAQPSASLNPVGVTSPGGGGQAVGGDTAWGGAQASTQPRQPSQPEDDSSTTSRLPVERALRNSEGSHPLARGSATTEQVAASPAGIEGWGDSQSLAAQHPVRVRAYLAPDRAADYHKTRGAFQAHWSKDTLRLSAGMRYFLTHSNAGCSLLTEEGDHLNAVIGPRLTLKGEVPEDQDVDMVVVPTLRTTSRKYLQVIERKQPVLVVKAEDIRHAALGDQVPAWRWQGGAYFQYPSLDRKA